MHEWKPGPPSSSQRVQHSRSGNCADECRGLRENGSILAAVRPLIGIPLCLDDRGRWRPGRDYVYGDRAYADAVEAAGGIAVHLATPGNTKAHQTKAIAERLDGLLIPGGDDFGPDDYENYPEGVFNLASEAQIAFDRSLLKDFLELKKPMLGVCYGMQLLALHAGGSLYPHLPTDLGDETPHSASDGGTSEHPIEIEPGSKIAGIVGLSTLPVNSRHHQGVRDAGSLSVAARSRDRLIEAIEQPGDSFVAGVQWHPEVLAGPAGAGLFNAFVEAARSGMGWE